VPCNASFPKPPWEIFDSRLRVRLSGFSPVWAAFLVASGRVVVQPLLITDAIAGLRASDEAQIEGCRLLVA